MLNQFNSTVKAIICFLKILNVKVNNSTVNESLQNHPDWPTLLCISDALNKWNIPNGAGQFDIANFDTDIEKISTPFIAHTNDKDNSLAIVTNVTNDSITLYQKNYNKASFKRREAFLKEWNGVYLIAEPNEYSGEHDYQKIKRKTFFASLMPTVAFISILTASFLILYRNIWSAQMLNHFPATGIYLQYFLTLFGVSLSALLLWYEVDKTNPLLHKVCTGIAKGNCNAILNSKAAKIFNWLSWTEVGFFYFAGAFISLLFAGKTILSTVSLLALFNLIAIPYSIFSVYYQWRVAKQWCILCLAIQAVLLAGLINAIIFQFLNSIYNITFFQLVQTTLLYLIPVLIWFSIKPYILRLQDGKNTKREYLRMKFNAEIFETLLKKQKQITIPTDGLGIVLGNSSATNTIIKVCNPYCGPCAKAHPEIEKLITEIPKLNVQIIFTSPNNPDSYLYKPVSHLLAIQDKGDKTFLKRALDDWYLQEKKDYAAFASMYPLNGELALQGEKIEKMDNWCLNMNISFTPTIFVNGYQLPDEYSIQDLKYFLLE